MVKNITFFFYLLLFFGCHTTQNRSTKTHEPHRPLFHFTPPKMWMNDPNGMVYFEGEYHLFYQHYPDSTVWGPMHWGHAVSSDMVHWEHLPIALYPDSLGMIFSGSAVVDWKNTSGFGKNGKPPLVAIFTHHLMEGEKAGRSDFQYQSIAYSNDRGRTWTKYAGNPVVPNTQKIRDFRDPKVIWHEASKQWVMVFAAQDHVKFWSSPDLKNWKHLSDFGKEWGARRGVWECPDFFPMAVERDKSGGDLKSPPDSGTKWVLLLSLNPGAANGGSGTQYFVGDFDGKTFTLDPDFAGSVQNGKGVWLDWGRDNYAGVTWSDIPKSDGRRLFMGWMSNWDYATTVPTQAWRSAMTLPRTLALRETNAGLRLVSQPVKELETLRKGVVVLSSQSLDGPLYVSPKYDLDPAGLEVLLELEFPDNAASSFAVVLTNADGEEYRVGFDAGSNEFFSDRTRSGDLRFSDKFAFKRHIAPRWRKDKTLKMHLFFDVASCELFADGGETVMTDIFFPTKKFSRIRFESVNGAVNMKSAMLYEMKSAR